MHGTRLKLKTLESLLLDYIYTCPPGNAGKSSKRREGICLLYIYCIYIVSIVHTVTFTFPGASVHVVKLGIYMVHCIPTWCRSHTHASSTQNFIFLSLSLEPWSVGHERELRLRSRYTGCYNERDVISGISRFCLRGGS